jgi:hypothetical protein
LKSEIEKKNQYRKKKDKFFSKEWGSKLT